MISKKWKEEIIRLNKEVEKLKYKNEELMSKNSRLKCEYNNLKSIKLDEFGTLYDYAILINKGRNGDVLFWNDGRYEENVKQLLVDISPYQLPEIKIIK